VAFPTLSITLGLAIRWRNPPTEAGPRTQYFYGYKEGYRVLRGQGEGLGLDIWVVGGLGQEEKCSGGRPKRRGRFYTLQGSLVMHRE
jgi:hypothetical protein